MMTMIKMLTAVGVMYLMVMMGIIPHVVIVGRALVPMLLLVVGFQLLIHVKGAY